MTFQLKKYPPLDHEQLRRLALEQRKTVLGAGVVYGLAGITASLFPPLRATIGLLAFAPAVSLVLLYALGFLAAPVVRLQVIPTLAAAMFGAEIILGVGLAPALGAPGFALMFGIVALFVALLAGPAPRALTPLGILTVIMIYGGLIHLLMNGDSFQGITAMIGSLPFMIAAALFARRFQAAEAAAAGLRQELERRATSDGLTGVSNRAHITLLAQNEFTRARRYGEPYSCLMIEVDGFADLAARWGARAAETVVQVLSGYCVVVMRHCDSFGRLSPARFLALLPETQGEGAIILAHRMCRDTAVLDVAVAGQFLNFTISIGAADIHLLDRGSGDMLRRAEQALDDAIEHGRGRAVLGIQSLLPPEDENHEAAPDNAFGAASENELKQT